MATVESLWDAVTQSNTKFISSDPSIRYLSDWGIFCDWKLPTQADWALIDAIAFSTIIIGVKERSFTDSVFNPKVRGAPWDPALSDKRIIDSTKGHSSTNTTILMVWAVRRKAWLRRTIDRAVKLAVDMGAQGVLLDCEKEWIRSTDIGGFGAACIVRELFDNAKDKYNCSGMLLIMASYSDIPESCIELAAVSDICVPMAYSFWRPTSGAHWSHTNTTFPGMMQARAFASYSQYVDPMKIVMGLGNYNGGRLGKQSSVPVSHMQSMRWSAVETIALGCDAAWWWSLKHLRSRTQRAEDTRRFFGVQDYYG